MSVREGFTQDATIVRLFGRSISQIASASATLHLALLSRAPRSKKNRMQTHTTRHSESLRRELPENTSKTPTTRQACRPNVSNAHNADVSPPPMPHIASNQSKLKTTDSDSASV